MSVDIAFWLVSRTVLPLLPCKSKLPPIELIDNVLAELPLLGLYLPEGFRDAKSCGGSGNALRGLFGEAGDWEASMENGEEGDDMAKREVDRFPAVVLVAS